MASFSLPFVGAGGEPIDFIATINSHGIASLPPVKPNADLATELQITLRLPDRSIRTVRLRQRKAGSVSVQVLGTSDVDRAMIRHEVRLSKCRAP